MSSPAKSERLPSLDGLRGLSIALVIIGHGVATMPNPGRLSPLMLVAANAELGVNFFFVISGYLITYLILAEMRASGALSLSGFYIRRVTRIFPAFYAFLMAAALLALSGYISVSRADLIAAGCFLWNYIPWAGGWWLGQTWSLSVEEQFYLIWPSTLYLLGARRAARIAAALIVIEPAIRVASYFLAPSYRDRIPIMLHTRIDILMFGCLLALLRDNDEFHAVMERFSRPAAMAAASIFIFVLDPILAAKWRGEYLLPLGFTLEGAAIALIIFGLVRRPDSPIGRVFNSRPLVWLGSISYSLYLWQQIFLTPLNRTFTGKFPLNFIFAIAIAALSYYCIEKPVLRLRPRLLALVRNSGAGAPVMARRAEAKSEVSPAIVRASDRGRVRL